MMSSKELILNISFQYSQLTNKNLEKYSIINSKKYLNSICEK